MDNQFKLQQNGSPITYRLDFDGGYAQVMESRSDPGNYIGIVSWNCLGVYVSVNSNIDPVMRRSFSDATQWCREVIETGPGIAVHALDS